ncbi:LPS translocon maturation chaperone LptM [Colwellia psychrerythraea]|uniref:Lipoprotein n=1 Tax=Colwellia psychrerythraea TaxID=28229 RepID=A0A099L4B5_COLPS|nr:lipoprotein [Colwellia psychrerythraea]KGJ97671.1 hypothetical protein GAB14E_1260 [Colwellia psychrerythraea]
MRSKRLRYLQQKLHQEFKFKSTLLAFFATILLSACGIKGDLYETPEPVVSEENKVTESGEDSQESDVNKSAESQQKSATTPDEVEQQEAVPQAIEQSTTPSAKQSTDAIKE